jgi:flagellar protein FlbD
MRHNMQGENMIRLTKINGQEFFINSDLMEFIETTPDTIITLTTGKKVLVRESADEVVDRIVQYKSKALRNWELLQKKD